MNILKIDTTDNKRTVVSLKTDEKLFEEAVETKELRSSQVVLGLVQKLLENSHIDLQKINTIEVAKGPGSFTGTRVGVAIANAFSFCLQKPVNTNALSEIETPVYK